MSRRPDGARPSAEGTFAANPFDHLLVYTRNRRLTGELEVRAADGRIASIALWRGRITRVDLVPPNFYFGALVYELGWIDAATLDASLLEVAQQKKLHGEVLIARGAITPAQRDEALAEQACRKAHHVFSFSNAATFAFFESAPGVAEPPVMVDPLAAVWRGIREFPPTAAIQAVLAKYEGAALRMVNESPLAKVDLSPDERDVCEAFASRPTTLAELRAKAKLPGAQLERLLYLLLIGKCIEPTPVVPVATPAAPKIRESGEIARRPPSFRIPSAGSLPAMKGNPPSSPSLPAVTGTSFPSPAELGVAGIAARLEAAKKESYFVLLGLPEGASPEAVRAAYFRISKVWHPDRLPPGLEPARANVASLFTILTNAHRTLADAETRRSYLASRLGTGAKARPKAEALRDIDAALARRDFETAALEARTMHQADPEDAEALALLTWSEIRAGETHEEAAIRTAILALDRAVNSDRYCERAHFYRGLLWKRLGNSQLAIRDFARVLVLNPRHVEATREVRIHEMREKRR